MSDIQIKKFLNQHIKKVFEICTGNRSKIHSSICDLAGKPREDVNVSSLYNKAKTVVLTLKRIKKYYGINSHRYQDYLNKQFFFPVLKHQLSKEIAIEVSSSKRQKTHNNIETDSLKKQVEHQHTQLEKKNEANRQKGITINRLKQKVARQQRTIVRLKADIRKLKLDQIKYNRIKGDTKSTQCNTMLKVINEFKNEIDALQHEIDSKVHTTDENNNNSETNKEFDYLNTRLNIKGRPYTPDIRQMYYFMRSRNIGVDHIAPVIRFILGIVNIKCNELPSASTALSFNTEMGILSREQILENCTVSDNLTMYRDATTKKGRHFYGVELSNSKSSYTTGLREVSDGRAETYVGTTKTILNDIQGNNTHHIMSKVKNFMTDRSATEEKANKILVDQTSLPNTAINSFKCAVHPLLQFWEVCKNEVYLIEKESGLPLGEKSKESVIQCLIRFVSKFFYKDGSGDPIMSTTYLRTKGISTLPIENIRGNRFNTFFYNAAGTFYLAEHLLTYLKESKLTQLNYTQNFIVECLENKVILSLCQALGMISKIITEPYWAAAADESKSAIEMIGIYNRLIKVLEQISEKPSLLYENNIRLFHGPVKNIDDVTLHLFSKNLEFRDNTEIYIKRLCIVVKKKSEHLFKEFLPNGKFYDMSDEMIKSTKSCAPNNIKVERLMAKMDSSLKQAPNSSIETIESKIMYSNNKTHNWLNNKSKSDQHKLIKAVISRKKQTTLDNYFRKKDIFEQRVAIINERIKLKEKQNQRKNEKKEKMQKLLEEKGIWSSKDEMYDKVDILNTKTQKIKAIKSQINMYKDKDILNVSQADKDLLIFSKKGKPLSMKELLENLSKLIDLRNTTGNQLQAEQNPFSTPENLINKLIAHTWTDQFTKQDTIWQGRILSFENGQFKVISIESSYPEN